jgi:DNA polymerase V
LELCPLKTVSMNPKPFFTGKHMELFLSDSTSELLLPFFESGISAGFPSPAMDFKEEAIDLNKLLIKHPSATFLARAKGNSLNKVGIFYDDLMIVDRALEPTQGKLVVVFIDGEFTAKRVNYIGNQLWLMPENDDYEPVKVNETAEIITFGVIRHTIRTHI